jgi:hypothetical protein
MDRSKFLKLGALAGVGVISTRSSGLSFSQNMTQTICIYDNYVRGTVYCKAQIEKIDFEQPLEVTLQREESNQYDRFAIAVHVQQMKIGYIAAFENIVLANMMDAGVIIVPEIFIDPPNRKEYNDYITDSIFIRLHAELVSSQVPSLDLEHKKERADDSKDEYRIAWKRV